MPEATEESHIFIDEGNGMVNLTAELAQALMAEVEDQTDGSWPADDVPGSTVGLVDAHIDFAGLAKAALSHPHIAKALDHYSKVVIPCGEIEGRQAF